MRIGHCAANGSGEPAAKYKLRRPGQQPKIVFSSLLND
jgi:hypothetical protein